MKKTIITIVIVGLVVGLGYMVFGNQATNKSTTTTVLSAEAKINISYDGQDGKTALELLKTSGKNVETNKSSAGEYVTKIDGQPVADAKKYWMFYINGQAATVGADQYKTKTGEKIEWKLE